MKKMLLTTGCVVALLTFAYLTYTRECDPPSENKVFFNHGGSPHQSLITTITPSSQDWKGCLYTVRTEFKGIKPEDTVVNEGVYRKVDGELVPIN